MDSGTGTGLRVAHLISGDTIWGVEQYIVSLCQGLLERGTSVSAICSKPGAVASRLEEAGCALHIIPMTGYFDVSAIASIKRVLLDEKVNMVHCHMGLDSFLGVMATKDSALPLVATVHFEQPAYMSRNPVVRDAWRLIQRWKNSHIRRFLPISTGVADALAVREDVSKDKMTIVNPGTQVTAPITASQKQAARLQLGLAADAPLVFSLSRLSSEKGIDLLLRAIYRVMREFPQAQLIVAGDGPERQALERLIVELALSERVRLLGYVDDPAIYLAAADVFVSPSRQEAFGLATAQAMMTGLPVIATKTAGSVETVADGTTGVLVPLGSPDSLARAIVELLRQPALCEMYGRSGRERAIRLFSMDNMIEQTLSVYRRCIDGP